MPRFALHRTALLPVCAGITAATLRDALSREGTALESLVIAEQLAPLWHEATHHGGFADLRRHAAIACLRQGVAIREFDALFDAAGIPYTIIKGAATRALAYPDPTLRRCGDIDVLVAPRDRLNASRLLMEAGYQLHLNPTIVSHEVGLTKGLLGIDLHWDILRPGRTRIAVVDDMLARRVRHDGWWSLSDADGLFLMLVHAALNKHVSTTGLGLHRVADLALWWQRRDVEWPVVYQRLDASGLKTAAWTVLTWVGMLVDDPHLDSVLAPPLASLRPGRLRAAYLTTWLERDLSDRLTRHHALRLFGFSLFLHDRPTGAWHALRGRRHAARAATGDANAFTDLRR